MYWLFQVYCEKNFALNKTSDGKATVKKCHLSPTSRMTFPSSCLEKAGYLRLSPPSSLATSGTLAPASSLGYCPAQAPAESNVNEPLLS